MRRDKSVVELNNCLAYCKPYARIAFCRVFSLVEAGEKIRYFLFRHSAAVIFNLFIDTANLEQIREANALGVLDGVTTNPSLMAKEGIKGVENQHKHYIEICNIVDGDVSAQCVCFANLFQISCVNKEFHNFFF